MQLPAIPDSVIPKDPTDKFLIASFGLSILGLLCWLVRTVVTRFGDSLDRNTAAQVAAQLAQANMQAATVAAITSLKDAMCNKLDHQCDENTEAHEKTRQALTDALRGMQRT